MTAAVSSTQLKPMKKSDLPQKTCATCGLPFAWRKKWAKVWDDVRYCSDRCRRARPSAKSTTGTSCQ
ncbi:DUF2256 domain-containing protein [Litoreibacter albidus]|uniref:DUF2256 domain-containing protein n=1 Tax=Litoreibacter albidus TaxID=670155 RepID=UPI0037357208